MSNSAPYSHDDFAMLSAPESGVSSQRARRWSTLAEASALRVNSKFGHRLLGLPGTWIASLSYPDNGKIRPWAEWHYWWQAHYLDALVDAGFRALRDGETASAKQSLDLGKALLRGILLRNFGRFPNHFFDDMAWLALAADRLNRLSLEAVDKEARLARFATSTLTRQLHKAHDSVLGGGIYWSRKRDYKNTPANGPAALHLARAGYAEQASSLLDWLRDSLFDPDQGLYLDGIHPSSGEPDIERNIYTYNQGPVLAALLERDQPAYLSQAEKLINDVGTHLLASGPAEAVATMAEAAESAVEVRPGLRLEPGGDGSLFTGILCRYLAVAGLDTRLPAAARQLAATLVIDTAEVIAEQPEPSLLSAALQRWTVFEAAAALGQS